MYWTVDQNISNKFLDSFTLDAGVVENKDSCKPGQANAHCRVILEWALLHLALQSDDDIHMIRTMKWKNGGQLVKDFEHYIQFGIMFWQHRVLSAISEFGKKQTTLFIVSN